MLMHLSKPINSKGKANNFTAEKATSTWPSALVVLLIGEQYDATDRRIYSGKQFEAALLVGKAWQQASIHSIEGRICSRLAYSHLRGLESKMIEWWRSAAFFPFPPLFSVYPGLGLPASVKLL